MTESTESIRVAIIGCGAQGLYAVETFSLTGVIVVAVFDPIGQKVGQRLEGYEIQPFHGRDTFQTLLKSGVRHFIAGLSDNATKRVIYDAGTAEGLEAVNAIHPRAVVSGRATLGTNVIVNANAVVQPRARVDNGVMIHAGTVIEHDDRLDDFCNIGPGTRLCGWVHVGSDATIGAGATLVPGIEVGQGALVTAGAVVIRNVEPGVTVAGVPAETIKT